MSNFTDIKSCYLNILQRDASDDEVRGWEAPVNSGALTMEQVRQAFINSSEGQNVHAVIRMYQAAFGRVPDQGGLKNWVNSGLSMEAIADGFANSQEFLNRYGSNSVSEAFVTSLYYQVLGRAPDAAGLSNWVNSGLSAAKILAGFSESQEFKNSTASSVSTFLDNAGKGTEDYSGSLNDYVPQPAGQTFTLTSGIDDVAGTAGNDTIKSIVAGGLSALDSIDGAGGTDTLNVTDTDAIAVSSTTTVSNVETAKLASAQTVSADVSGWTGLNSLTVTEVGGNASGSIVAAGTTAVTVTDSAQAAGAITVNGGAAVSVTSTGATTGAITVGTTTAPTGAVMVSRATTGAASAGAITVKGGTTVDITQTASNAVNTTQTNGAVAVTGGASTTAVTVTSTAAATASATVAGITANSVSITDVNSGSTTAAGTITSVNVNGFTTLSIADNALTDLHLANGSGNIIIDNSGLTTATNKTLALTLNGQTGGTLDDADIYTTLNVTTATKNSTLANITTGAMSTLTVAGTHGLALTSTAGMTALSTVAVSGAAGVTADFSGATVTAVDTSATTGTSTVTIDASKATFTGGAGIDKVTLSAATPGKAISLGAGDDTLTLGNSSTPTAALAGGEGTDTLTMTAALAATASGSGTFAGIVTGFERVILTGATNQTIDLSVLGDFNHVTTSGGNGLTLSNLPSDGTLVLNGAGTAYTIGNSAFTAGASDKVNLLLTDGSGAGVAFASTGITASGVETFAITTADTQATPSGTFNDSVTLLGNSVKAITVGGNAGLTLTATSTAATTVDASGITLGGFTYTSGALTSAATIKGSATGTNTVNFSAATGGVVTYTGGSGNDAVTASNGKANVIDLGNGTNTLTSTTGNHTVTGGTGADTVTLTTGNNTVDLGNGANAFTATTGNNTYTGGTGVDTVTVGSGVNTITTGTGADVVTFSSVATNGNSYSAITDAHAGLRLVFTDSGQTSGTSTFTSAKISLADTAVFQDYLDAAVNASGDNSTNSNLAWFQYNSNTFIVEDNSNSATYQNGVDSVVKLVGVVDLASATFAAVATTSGSLTLA